MNAAPKPGAIGSSDPAWRKFRISVFRAYGIRQWRDHTAYTYEHGGRSASGHVVRVINLADDEVFNEGL